MNHDEKCGGQLVQGPLARNPPQRRKARQPFATCVALEGVCHKLPFDCIFAEGLHDIRSLQLRVWTGLLFLSLHTRGMFGTELRVGRRSVLTPTIGRVSEDRVSSSLRNKREKAS